MLIYIRKHFIVKSDIQASLTFSNKSFFRLIIDVSCRLYDNWKRLYFSSEDTAFLIKQIAEEQCKFCYDMNTLENSGGAFYKNGVRIWSLHKIVVHCLSNWLIIELHFPVTPAVGYGVVKIDASNYWMFLHPIVGWTSNYWIKSNSWIKKCFEKALVFYNLQEGPQFFFSSYSA